MQADGRGKRNTLCVFHYQASSPSEGSYATVAATGLSTKMKYKRMIAEGERPTPSAQQDGRQTATDSSSGQDDVGKTNLHWGRINERYKKLV
jgi:hypothetical protein